MPEQIQRVAILASGDRKSEGGGSTAEKFARDVLNPNNRLAIPIEIGLVICNNPQGSVAVYDRFDQINTDLGLSGDSAIEVVNIGPNTHPGGPQDRGLTKEESEAILKLLIKRRIDFALALGYMRIITGDLINEWGWHPEYADDEKHGFRQGIYHPKAKIGNNHPSLLPLTADTHGEIAHLKALSSLQRQGKVARTAMTWHLVSADVDRGPIIHEEPVDILPDDTVDTLNSRVQLVEKEHTAPVFARHLALRAAHLLAA